MFDDITTPNVALEDKDIDMNFFQHNSYLRQYNQEHGTDLQVVGGRGVYKIQNGLYSDKIDSVEDFKEGDKILISSDIVNRALCLKLLEEQGLVKLNSDVEFPGLPDIEENPKNLDIVEVNQVVTHIDSSDVTAGIVKGETMVRDGRDPSNALAYASGDLLKDFEQCLVTRPEDLESEWALGLFDEFNSDEMHQYYINTYGEGVMLVE